MSAETVIVREIADVCEGYESDIGPQFVAEQLNDREIAKLKIELDRVEAAITKRRN
jgi:hypothetical protein